MVVMVTQFYVEPALVKTNRKTQQVRIYIYIYIYIISHTHIHPHQLYISSYPEVENNFHFTQQIFNGFIVLTRKGGGIYFGPHSKISSA